MEKSYPKILRKAFPKTSSTKMKPSKCPAKEKKEVGGGGGGVQEMPK